MDLPILKYVDVLIGFSLVMLLVATVALSISQALLNMTASRARHLAVGLEQLIRQVHPQLLDSHAREMANQVLMHPMVRQPRSAPSRWMRAVWNWVMGLLERLIRKLIRKLSGLRLAKAEALPITTGAVILREELAICLLEWAAEDGTWTMTATPDKDPARSRIRREALANALRQRGIEDPSTTLKAFRLQAMKNEQEHPEQTAQRWRSQALVQTASSDFLAGLFQSFDTTMTRATSNFGSEAQVWVSIVAFVLVLAVQLDSFALVRRLSVDDRYRNTLVEEAKRLEGAPTPPDGSSATDEEKKAAIDATAKILTGTECAEVKNDPKTGKPTEPAARALNQQRCRINATLAVLQSPVYDLRAVPYGNGGSWLGLPLPSPEYLAAMRAKFPGLLVAWLLVSLGAPFWFDMIKNLFKLRSPVAQKDEADRTERQAASTTAPSTTATTTTTATTPAASTTPNANPPATTTTASNNGAGVLDPDDGLGEMGNLAATGAHG
jgi:hypothetical protein